MTVRTVGVPDANASGATVLVATLPDPGQAARAQSLPVTASTEDVALRTAANASLTAIATGTALSGLGAFTAVPAGTTNGAAITLPGGARGLRFYLGASDTVTFTIATTAPTSAPALTYMISGANDQNWDENLAAGAVVYVTAKSGAPIYRAY